MKTAHALELLDGHQRKLLAQLAHAETLVGLDPAIAAPELARARWQMVRLMRGYQVFKHTEIFDPAIRALGQVDSAIVRAMKANCLAAGDGFSAYVTAWSSRDVIAEWSTYQFALMTMASQIRDHITAERRNVQALLAQAEDMRRFARTPAAQTRIGINT